MCEMQKQGRIQDLKKEGSQGARGLGHFLKNLVQKEVDVRPCPPSGSAPEKEADMALW